MITPDHRALRGRVPVQALRKLHTRHDRHQRLQALQCMTAQGQTLMIPVTHPFPLEAFLTTLRELNPPIVIDAHC